jgi:hypothetical protein
VQRLRISEPMYGDQVFLDMHHRLAFVILNLGKLAQAIPLIEIILYSEFSQKNYK